MSKFTKALEKLQEKNGNQTYDPGLGIPEVLGNETADWQQAVRVVRNTVPDRRIVVYHFPYSFITEQYRTLRTNLKNEMAKDQAKVVAISSSTHGEGKTVTSMNLALALAELGDCKVVLLEGDLRLGRVSEYFGLPDDLPGLSNVLSEGISVDEVLVRNSVEGLCILPRGEEIKNPSGLLSARKLRSLLSELRRRFDYVVIDTPPITSVTDASVLAKEADGLLMVIQGGKTPKNVISYANLLFRQAGVKLYGYVLTSIENDASAYLYEKDSKKKSLKWRSFVKDAAEQVEQKEQQLDSWWQKKVQKTKETEAEDEPDEETPAGGTQSATLS